MRLTSPKFNLMGDAEDTVKMVDHVVSKYPKTSFIGMVGISAGSGLLITYLGKQGIVPILIEVYVFFCLFKL